MTAPASIRSTREIDSGLPRYESMAHVLRAAVAGKPDLTAVVADEREITYREFGRAVNGLATDLERARGRGGRVIAMMPNSIEFDVAVMAAMTAGAQAVPVNPFFKQTELERVLAGVDADVILCDASTRAVAEAIAPGLGVGEIWTLGPDGKSLDAWTSDTALDAEPETMPTADDLALLIFTGGSTGLPKGVDHTHRGMIQTLLLHCTVWPVEIGAEVFLNVAPMFHIWGLVYATWVPIYAQSTLVMVPRYEPDRVVEALGRYRVTIFGGGPAPIYMGLLGSPLFDDADLSALKYCLSGGAPCPEDLHREWLERTGCPLFEGWGMSEGAPLCLNPAGAERKTLSVGTPVPETDIEIVDIALGDTVLHHGEPGEVRVRGPQLMRGYRNNPEETARAVRDGWLYTGDIGYLDEDGYLFLVDRKKDLIIVGGYNVYPREVDEVLFNHPKIREAAAVGKPDPRLGEVVVAYVVPDPGVDLDGAEILAHCKEHMVKYKRPAEVYIVDDIPRTRTNKINRLALREDLRGRS